jgi:hypothetical protein
VDRFALGRSLAFFSPSVFVTHDGQMGIPAVNAAKDKSSAFLIACGDVADPVLLTKGDLLFAIGAFAPKICAGLVHVGFQL